MLLRHRTVAALVAVGSVIALPAAAHGSIREIGALPKPLPKLPCPAVDSAHPCKALSVTTTFQVKVGTKKAFMTIPKDGRIVAWTVSLGKPTTGEDTFFTKPKESTGGGVGLGNPQAGLQILRFTKSKKRDKTLYRNIAQSPLVNLRPYFGHTVTFPLVHSLPANKGRIVALNVPTWAPVMAIDQPNTTSYRASRIKTKCGNTAESGSDVLIPSMNELGKLKSYQCLYQGVRLMYSATIITNPAVFKTKR